MGRFARSWALVKGSAAVLRSDRELLLFPLLSGLCTLLVAATFIAPLAFGGAFAGIDEGDTPVWLWPLAFAFYLSQYFVIFFFNAALVGAARIRLDGGDPTVADGFRIALSRWPQILGYAAIAATVGMILRMIQERAGLLGLAWTVASLLVVPVLVNENIGPIDAVKRSTELLKRTWGENLVGNVGIGFVFGLLTIGWVLLAGTLFVFALKAQSAMAIMLTIALAVLGFLLLGLVQSALQGVYAAALHRYAQVGDAGAGFEGAMIADAFRIKA